MTRSLRSTYLLFALGVGVLLCVLVSASLWYYQRVDTRQLSSAALGAVEQKLNSDLRTRAEDMSRQIVGPLSASLNAGDAPKTAALLAALLKDRDVLKVELQAPDGTLLYTVAADHPSSADPPLIIGTSIALPAAHGALGRGAALRDGAARSGQRNGTLAVWMSRASIRETIGRLGTQVEGQQAGHLRQRLRVFGAVTLPLLLLAVFGAGLIARSLSRPISALVRTANRIGEGDYTRPLDVQRRDELGELQDAIERMRQSLSETTITKNYLTTVLNSLGDAVLVTSPDGLIKSSNQAAHQLLGYPPAEIDGKPLLDFVDEPHRATFDLNSTVGESRETVVRTASGQTIPVSMAGSPITTDDPQFQGRIYVARDITERKRAERRIRYLARYDTLTKMPNRMQFQHLLQQAIARARRNQRLVALLYLDLDRFKEVNDTFGHAAGDRTLEILSERLTRNLNKEMVIGRLAGDEFAMFVDALPADIDPRAPLAALARTLLDEISRAFYVSQEEVYLTASVGIALCPHDAENVIDLIRNADAAMYHAKLSGGNSYAFYVPDMNAAAVERLMLKSKLRRALERDELVILYQPKVDLRDGRVIGAEALLRWRLPGHGDISPSQFIPLAEETSLILDIGEWVMNRVCADFREWQQTLPQPGRVSINLSLRQLKQMNFLARFAAVFKNHGVSPSHFELEVTETTLMTDVKRTVRLLNELYSMGLHLAIDDFGTGYSSLSALQQFPIDTLKIDQSFVRDVAVDTDDAAIVRTIIDMGKSLEMEVVAEGVEGREQLEFLRRHGCYFAQGRLFGEVLESKKLLAIYDEQRGGAAHFAELCAQPSGTFVLRRLHS